MENIVKPNSFDFNKLVYDEPMVNGDNSDKYIIVKLWYDFTDTKDSDSPETVFVKNPSMPLSETSKNELVFELNDTNDLKLFYDTMDQSSINYLKTSGLLKKYKLKDITYKTIVNETNDPNKNMLRLNLSGTTNVYTLDKKVVSNEQQTKLLVKDAHVMTIVEPDAIIIDVHNKTIFTNMVTRQVLVTKQKQHKPQKIVLSGFSFVDSDNDSPKSVKHKPKKVSYSSSSKKSESESSRSDVVSMSSDSSYESS